MNKFARLSGLVFTPILVIAFSVNSFGADYTVLGCLETSTGTNLGCNQTVERVKVEMYDEDDGPDDYLGIDYSRPSSGLFQFNFSMYIENPDVYLVVTYKFQAPDSRYVYVRDLGSANNLVATQPGGVWYDIPAGTNNLGTINLPSNKPNIGTHAATCLYWIKAHSTSWSVPQDLIAYARPNDTSQSSCGGDSIYIQKSDYDNPGTGSYAFSDIHHETGHFVAYNAYGDRWPPGIGINPHQYDMQTNEGHAICEGWAEYVAYCTAPADAKNQMNPATAPTWWRGQSGTGTANTGTDNAGDIVEGAIWRIWATINDFEGVFKALCDHDPMHFKEWLDGYGADKSWSINSTFEACQANGIVYTRAKIATFPEGAPPNDAPPDTGNTKAIGGITFLRGTVKPTAVQNTKAELQLATNSSVISAAKKKLGHKTATAGLAETCTLTNWTFLAEKAWADDIEFNTTSLGDSDRDLVIQAENGHGWWDNFDPDFAGDSTANRDSDEKWLKHLQTWYNQDIDPSNDDEGKVILDNTAPTISNRKPQ